MRTVKETKAVDRALENLGLCGSRLPYAEAPSFTAAIRQAGYDNNLTAFATHTGMIDCTCGAYENEECQIAVFEGLPAEEQAKRVIAFLRAEGGLNIKTLHKLVRRRNRYMREQEAA